MIKDTKQPMPVHNAADVNEVKEALNNFRQAYDELACMWVLVSTQSDIMDKACASLDLKDYPFFSMSFDELGIGTWCRDMLRAIDRKEVEHA